MKKISVESGSYVLDGKCIGEGVVPTEIMRTNFFQMFE